MAPWPRAPVIPQLVDRKTFRDNRWVWSLDRTFLGDYGRIISKQTDFDQWRGGEVAGEYVIQDRTQVYSVEGSTWLFVDIRACR
ncbi:hypothetical protein TNCV_1663291 [Trichonephila clavipes]|nr:hypothetical protein TNCV_1663291 [Trichonephila clavipes]